MPNPGDPIFQFGRVMIDENGHCRVEVRPGKQTDTGPQFDRSRFAHVDLRSGDPAAYAAFRAALEKLALEHEDIAAVADVKPKRIEPPARQIAAARVAGMREEKARIAAEAAARKTREIEEAKAAAHAKQLDGALPVRPRRKPRTPDVAPRQTPVAVPFPTMGLPSAVINRPTLPANAVPGRPGTPAVTTKRKPFVPNPLPEPPSPEASAIIPRPTAPEGSLPGRPGTIAAPPQKPFVPNPLPEPAPIEPTSAIIERPAVPEGTLPGRPGTRAVPAAKPFVPNPTPEPVVEHVSAIIERPAAPTDTLPGRPGTPAVPTAKPFVPNPAPEPVIEPTATVIERATPPDDSVPGKPGTRKKSNKSTP